MKQVKKDESLENIKSLIIDFLNSKTEEDGERVLYFERKGLGGLHLNHEKFLRYNKCLRDLARISVKDDDLSLNTVEEAFQEALLKALSPNNCSTHENSMIDEILESLKKKLTAKRISYCCFVPVWGIMEKGLPFSIGQVELAVFDDVLVDRFKEIVSKHENQRNLIWEDLKADIDRGFYKKVCSLVIVEAKDYEAAQVIAIKELRKVLDILNFFSELTPFNPNAWIYLPGDLEPYSFQTIILNEDDGTSHSTRTTKIGPLQELEISRIIESNKNNDIGFDYIVNLLKKNDANKNKLGEALITAIQWAGRAVISNRREEAFLLYAIALESIILVDNPKTELSYRLRIRVAHLVAREAENRNEVANTVKELYNLRSKLVHDGKYEITDLELDSMKSICTTCIERLCTDPLFQKMTSPDEFSKWLEDQILC
jgi:Apea-like HEPN